MTETNTLSEIVRMLEIAFDVLNEEYFESTLSKTVITIQSTPKAYGHFSVDKIWNISNNESAHEINLGAETLDREIENVIATLLHEMVHQYCAENKIKDTSRSGTYHNKMFKGEAEKRGLIIEYDKRIGWSFTEPSKTLKTFIESKEIFHQISLFRNTPSKEKEKGKSQSSTRKYVCPCCDISVRATKEVRISCMECDVTMLID